MSDKESPLFKRNGDDGELVTLCAVEFEALRCKGPKLSRAQADQMRHLEEHLDAGDVVCRCGMNQPRRPTTIQ